MRGLDVPDTTRARVTDSALGGTGVSSMSRDQTVLVSPRVIRLAILVSRRRLRCRTGPRPGLPLRSGGPGPEPAMGRDATWSPVRASATRFQQEADVTEESHAPGGPHLRATKYSPDGTYEDVSDKLVGAESFLDSWERSPEIPQEFRGSGWQGPDEAHPPGSGQPAYRVVYKTMRLVPYPAIVLNWPNLRVSIVNGDFDRGGMCAPTAIPARTRRHYVIPEYGRVIESPSGGTTYLAGPDMTAAMSGWQETVKAASAVKIIIHVDVNNAEDCSAMMVAGRRQGDAQSRFGWS